MRAGPVKCSHKDCIYVASTVVPHPPRLVGGTRWDVIRDLSRAII